MDSKKHVFTVMEKKFMDIIKKYSGIIENKDTDGATLRRKNEAWDRISAEYNASPVTTSPATHKQLRRLWMNVKQRQREALTKERQHRFATGGGPSTSDADIDPDVSIATPALIVGIESAMDSDTILEINNPDPEPHFVQLNTLTESSVAQNESTTEDYTVIPPILSQSNKPKSTLSIRDSVIEKEYEDRRRRFDEKHAYEILILQENYKESQIRTKIAENILKQQDSKKD